MTKSYKPVNFNLDFKKLIACLTYFARHCEDMTKLKAIKLLYFLDKYHLVKYGRPVLGDNYILMGLGPVPSMTLDIINEIQDAYQHKIKMLDPRNKEYFGQFLKVAGTSKYPVFHAIKEADLDELSQTEKEALFETLKNYGKYTASTLVEKTHKDATCKKTEINHYIDYKLFFEGEPKADPHAFEYFRNLEEDVSFLNVLDANA